MNKPATHKSTPELSSRSSTAAAPSSPAGAMPSPSSSMRGQVQAVDNRCPHMGFPLERGSVKDGILTCHWHHARFELSSGGTFNPFADDVRTFPVDVVDGQVWVDPSPVPRDEARHWQRRLEDGMEHSLRLVVAKSVLGLQSAGVNYREPLSIGARFGTTYSASGWGAAMSILTCTANMLPQPARG